MKLLVALAVFLLALVPRLAGLETFVTTDEIFWVGRSGNFARALQSGRLDLTLQTGHPGVTTMWLGLIGMGPEQAQRLGSDSRAVSRSQVSGSPDFLPRLAAARRIVALATALGIALATLALWRLLGPGAALLGGVALAFDPFILAHSQLLHLDALLSTCMLVALLAGMVRWLRGGGRSYLVLSGVTTGLAQLTKSPAFFLVAFLPLIALLAAWRRGQLFSRAIWLDLLAWLGLAALTYVVCWPATWVAPLESLRAVLGFVNENTSPDNDPLFYPAAFALRTTPLVLVGLVLLGVEALVATRRRAGACSSSGIVVAALVLLAYALLFGLAMTLSAKSFDRYLLPAVLALDVLAGLGLALSARRLRWIGGAGFLLAGALILPLLIFPVALSQPYALAWFNPLAGGGPAAARLLSVGWGEGLDQVARYLNLNPDASRLRAALPGEIYTAVLDSQLVGQVVPAAGGDPAPQDASYFVWYIRGPGDLPPVYDPRFQVWRPELVVRLADLDYARLYDASVGVPVGASFGQAARLEGYAVDALSVRPGRPIGLRLYWRTPSGSAPGDPRVVVTLRDPAGREAARGMGSLGSPEPGQLRLRSYQLTVPPDLPAGDYLLWVGLQSADGQPIPLLGPPESLAPGAPEAVDRAVLRSVQVR